METFFPLSLRGRSRANEIQNPTHVVRMQTDITRAEFDRAKEAIKNDLDHYFFPGRDLASDGIITTVKIAGESVPNSTSEYIHEAHSTAGEIFSSAICTQGGKKDYIQWGARLYRLARPEICT